jgi:hypothetical protein
MSPGRTGSTVLLMTASTVTLVVAIVTTGFGAVAAGGMQSLAEEAGARLERKLIEISQYSDAERSGARLTPLLELEIIGYLRFQGAMMLPVGVTNLTGRIGENGLVTAEAVVDLSVMNQERARGSLGPLSYLKGPIPVAATGRVHSGEGVARIEIESVTVGGIQVPEELLQELVRRFTRTPSHPDGTQLDVPIALPYGIAEFRLSPGEVVVVQ